MNQVFKFCAIFAIAFICAATVLLSPAQPGLTIPNVLIESAPRLNPVRDSNFKKHFQELGIEGSIMIYDLNKDRTYQHQKQSTVVAGQGYSTIASGS